MINRKFLYISNVIVDVDQVCIFSCKDNPNEHDKQTAGPLFIVHHNIFISLKKRCNIVAPLQPKQAFHRPHTCGAGYTAGTSNDFFIGFEMTKIYKARQIIVRCTLKSY